MSASKNQLVWFDIPCTDIDRAIKFYGAVLGCDVAKQQFEGFSMGILPHESGSVGGCLVVMSDTKPSDRGVLVYLNCAGRLDQAVAAVENHGGTVLQPKESIGPHGFRAIIKDSEGNRVALHSM